MRKHIDAAAILSEEIRADIPEYRQRLVAADFEVTQDQYVTHKHLLDRLTPVIKSLRDTAQWLSMNSITDNDDVERLNSTIALLSDMMVPLALLKIKATSSSLRLQGN